MGSTGAGVGMGGVMDGGSKLYVKIKIYYNNILKEN